MSYQRTQWRTEETPLSATNMNNIEDGVEEALETTRNISSVVGDMFASVIAPLVYGLVYPVGSYYETSDSSFDPNEAWGGTWVLEASGKVHVSAGTGYALGSTGGNKDAIVPYHKHTLTAPSVTVPAHGHGFTQPKIPNHKHEPNSVKANALFCIIRSISGRAGLLDASKVTTGSARYIFASNTSYDDLELNGYTGNPASLPSCTGGAVADKAAFNATVSGGSIAYAGTSGNLTNANMMPYIVVNRWHRTA